MEETKSELIAEIAELKLALLAYSRVFALTAEEVQYLKDDLIGKRFCRKLDEIEINLLTRIKQWQDEQNGIFSRGEKMTFEQWRVAWGELSEEEREKIISQVRGKRNTQGVTALKKTVGDGC